MRDEHRAYRIFRKGIFGIWGLMALMTFFSSTYNPQQWKSILFFFILAAVCEAVPVHLAERGQIALTHLAVWAAIVFLSPFYVMMIAFSAGLLVNGFSWLFARVHHSYVVRPPTRPGIQAVVRGFFLGRIARILAFEWLERHSYPLRHVIAWVPFNACVMGILAGASALVYYAFGGTAIVSGSNVNVSFVHTILPMIIAAAIYLILDTSIFSAICVFSENRPEYTNSWRSRFLRWKILILQTFPPIVVRYMLIAFFAFTLAWVYASHGMFFVAALIVPMYFIGHSMNQTEQMKRVYRETITALGTYVQLYHPYTRGHLKRVAELSERLARELNLPAGSVRWMPDAGLLHDIGKVGVSEEILDKPGRPTDDEWAKIQEHPVKGAEIIAQMEFLDKIVDWVKYHHKWYDGSGYPKDGKNGDIPIEAHIIAVADAFDAMTDDREMTLTWTCDACGYAAPEGERPVACPSCGAEKKRRYREPMTLDQALDELRRGTGTQFRPEVVKAFMRMIEREGVHFGDT